ncbi:hypothetical protein OV090_33930 [Nannocystis sp. RBIL2]|uniref:hypothetical protein n=1 Tax=Nannocystis sp. RBIL2 TaxID=2996788 RepID=UPI00226F9DC9|nr:hypothetical protein [Nannocystis sp. RBIL2]MCY1069790.1 hypothetical protein [Nannocystis sp. RBIL2]
MRTSQSSLSSLGFTLALAAAPACGGPAGQTDSDGSAGTTSTSDATTTSEPGSTTTVEPTGPTSTGTTAETSTGTTAEASTGTTAEVTTGTTTETSTSTTTAGTTTETSTTSTQGTSTGDTESGLCEPTWVVPDVAADALAEHDLLWIECELLSCGADEQPGPGETSLLCDEFTLDGVPLEYLGYLHPNATGAFTTDDVITPSNIAWLDGERHVYRYGESIYVMTEQDEARDQLEVFFTVRALELLRVDHPATYQALLVDTAEFPAESPIDGLGWKNRRRSVVISFDTTPLYIAAGITVLDAAPTQDQGLDLYSNVPAISIDRETILGSSDQIGSRPIYQKPGDDENFLRYMREGVAETLVHELLHRYVDRLNSVDAAMNDLYFRRGDMQACARFELEEALVAAASLLHFRAAGGVGQTYLDYYDVVLDANLEVVMQCPEFATWEAQFSAPSGVDPRYDLRLLDLE